MPIIIKLQDIDEALDNLRYKNETTLKSRLLRAVRHYYVDDASFTALEAINTEELVKTIWETGDDQDLLKIKRKNFSSLKSSVNTDLKKLYAEGKNPQGIVIGHENTFTISDEAKDRALTSIMDVFKEKGIDTQSKIGEILSALSDILSTTMSGPDMENTKEEIDRLKKVLGGISGKLGLSMQDIIHRAAAAGHDGQASGTGRAGAEPLRGEDISGYVHGELSMIDRGLKGLALEAAEAANGLAQTGVRESVRRAFAEIIQVLKDAQTDAADKAKKIMGAVEGMLSEAIDASGDALGGDQAGLLKEFFHEMAEGAGEKQVAADKMATLVQQTGGQLLAEVTAILADTKIGAGDKISKIMTAVNDMIGEAVGDAGLSEADKAHIRSMLNNITGNLNTLAGDSLAGFEILEEDIEETAIDEIVEAALPPEGVVLPPERVVEEIFEEVPDSPAATEEFAEEPELAAAANADLLEEITESDALEPAGDLEEVVEEALESNAEDTAGGSEMDLAAEGVIEEIFEEEVLEEAKPGTGIEEDTAELEALDQKEEEVIEEIIEEIEPETPDLQVEAADKNIDDDLREKTELLTRLAQAARDLESVGPDLAGGIYTEEEIRGKAKFLSEEFDRYLSIRDRYYNAHILIKGGDYLVGGAHLAKSVLAEHIATLPDFYISRFPITNTLFEIFVEQTGYITTAEKYGFSLVYFPRMQRSRDPVTGAERFALHNSAYSKKVEGACWHRPFGPGSSLHLKRTHPVVHVSLDDARAFATWTGKRLPTEIEWEAAARTARGYLYPWGNEWQENACNIEKNLHGDTTPVDHYIKFANALDVADMLGNVLEWTGDTIGDEESADTFIVKGAGWIAHGEINLTDRHYIEQTESSNILGFRCVAI